MNEVEKKNVRPTADDAAAEQHDKTLILAPATVVGVIVGFALAIVMVCGMFWIGDFFLGDSAEATVDRKQKLAELQTAAESALTSYGWIDEKDGIVRIPIDRAMILLAQEAARESQPTETSPTTSKDPLGGDIP